MKSLDDKARAERVVATLTRLRSVSDVFTVERELATLARGDARHEPTDRGNEHHDPSDPNLATRARDGFRWTFKHVGTMR
jgi:hypothetical protein